MDHERTLARSARHIGKIMLCGRPDRQERIASELNHITAAGFDSIENLAKRGI
jgi:hypothetical protein